MPFAYRLTRPARPGGRRRRARLSPLMRRILAVNLIALLILLGGVFYLTEFRSSLIEQRLERLVVEARIIAGAIGESATGGPEASGVEIEEAGRIIARLAGPTLTRARLFDRSGSLAVDSRFLPATQAVTAEPLPPIGEAPAFETRFGDTLDRLLDRLTPSPVLPRYRERADQRAEDYVEVISALAGEAATERRMLDEGTVLLSAAVPIQRFRRVLGALMLTADTGEIEELIRAEQLNILKVFAASLGVTLLLSLFLASTIARPINRLAAAAETVRRNIGRDTQLPQLERKDEIGDLSRALSDMTAALYRQIDAIESFAADVAHELKNPLSSLHSAVESLERTDKPELRAKLLAIIKEDVRRIDRLISDISDASRLDAELSRGRMEAVDMGELVAAVLRERAARQADGKESPALRCEGCDGKRLVVRGLESRMMQVVTNLLENATSFSPENGEILLRLSREGESVRLSIEDEGPGLPKGSERKIFQRFYSERPEKEAFGRHSGLGLSICRQIVEAHGGEIWAENRVSDDAENDTEAGNRAVLGARFVVRLPAGSR